jgi:hypothetical protein
MSLTKTYDTFLANWLKKQKKSVQRRNCTLASSNLKEPMEPPTPNPSPDTQKEPVEPPTLNPSSCTQKEPVELPTPHPSSATQKEPVERPTPTPSSGSQKEPIEQAVPNPTSIQKHQNPKWKNDEWFEKQYGDPDYYKRIKGLDH